MNKENILTILEKIALIDSDGHFTIAKFTAGWRVGFFTPTEREDYSDNENSHGEDINKSKMFLGKDFEQASYRAIMDFLERNAFKK